jgi:hypothetical protein
MWLPRSHNLFLLLYVSCLVSCVPAIRCMSHVSLSRVPAMCFVSHVSLSCVAGCCSPFLLLLVIINQGRG